MHPGRSTEQECCLVGSNLLGLIALNHQASSRIFFIPAYIRSWALAVSDLPTNPHPHFSPLWFPVQPSPSRLPPFEIGRGSSEEVSRRCALPRWCTRVRRNRLAETVAPWSAGGIACKWWRAERSATRAYGRTSVAKNDIEP